MKTYLNKIKVSTICLSFLLYFSGIIYGNSNIDSCLQELALYKGETHNLSYTNLLHELGKAYLAEKNYKQAQFYFQRSLKLSEALEEESLLIKNQINLGGVFFWLSDYKEAIDYSLKSIDNHAHLLTKNDSLKIFKNLAWAYQYDGNLEAAYSSLLVGLNISLHQRDSIEIAEAYCKLAEISRDQKAYAEAIEKTKKALAIFIQFNKPYDESFCYDLLGEIFHLMGSYEQALAYKVKSCQVGTAFFGAYEYAFCDYTIAETQLALGHYDSAYTLLKKALSQWEKIEFPEEQIKTQLVYASWYLKKGDCKASIDLVTACLNLAKQHQIKPLLKEVYENLYYTAQECNNAKLALESYQQYILYRDSINGHATQKAIANFSAIHQLKQQKQEFILLETRQKLQKTYYLILIGFSVFLVLCIGIGVHYLKKQYEHNTILKGKSKEIQQQNLVLEATNIQLVSSNEQLEQANHDLERFAYIISHDLRSPLRTVGNFTGLIEKKYRPIIDEDGKTYIDFVINGVKHMSQLLEDILLFSRAKRAPIKMETVDLNQLMKQLTQLLHTSIKEKNARIIVNDLPEVVGSSSQLGQVFQNIIENALKFMPPNQEPVIQIGAKLVGKNCQVSIQDNGIGIKQAYQEKIFSIFQRLHTTDKYAGTGLGLAICQTIIQRHKGKIWIESDGINGTIFHFTLMLSPTSTFSSTSMDVVPEIPVHLNH